MPQGSVALADGKGRLDGPVRLSNCRGAPPSVPSAFAGFRLPAEVVTDAAPVCPAVLDELIPSAGHAFVQNLRRGHYELGLDAPPGERVAAAFSELVRAI